MQVLKRHKKTVLIAVLLVAILIVSLFIVQNVTKPSPTSKSSPTPTPTRTQSPIPTTPTSTPAPTPTPAPKSNLYPGEVTQYQGQNLTSINDFLEDINQHPDVAIDGTQHINQTTYSLTVTGLVNNTLELTYNDLIYNFQWVLQVGTLLCVEGWSVTMLWQGIPINDLLQQAGIRPNATTLIFYGSDGYTTELPIDYVVQNNLILAYKVNNVTLPAEAGFPLMLVAQNQYGYKWIKWITEIDVSNDSSYLGYWESRGYPNNGTVLTNPDNLVTLSNFVLVAEAIVVFVACVVIAAAAYTVLIKKRKQNSNQFSEVSLNALQRSLWCNPCRVSNR
jgi:DMSO/TMAO reductase YedYZ molybdopterin-dependent catalytic subunit